MGTGADLRQARIEAGVSLASVAARSAYSESHLRNVELGRRTATPDVVLAYARVLGDGDVERRQLLAGLAAGVLGPAAAGELIHSGFSAAMAGRPGPDYWLERVEQYGADYMTAGAAALQVRLARDLVVMQQCIESPMMWSCAARALTTYGKTSAGPAEAVRWYTLAAAAADRSEDLGTRVWVRGRAALALAYEGAALPTAARFADAALELTDRPSVGRLNGLLARAHVAAIRGDTATANAADDEARRVHDRVAAPDGEISDSAVPAWRLATIRSLMLARQGRLAEGTTAQDEADRLRPAGLPRFATHIELHRALTLARSGDRSGGLALARSAWSALPETRRSQTLSLVLEEVKRAARPL